VDEEEVLRDDDITMYSVQLKNETCRSNLAAQRTASN